MSDVVGQICISNPEQGDEETEVVGNQREIEAEVCVSLHCAIDYSAYS
jgi:hypothetical protein